MNNAALISFSTQSARSIHNEAMVVAKNLKSESQRLFEILLVVERRQIYVEFEIPDLKTYCKEMLELSSSLAKEFGIVVRKALQVPQLAEAIRSGKISIYKARRICSVIDESNYQEWIDLAVHCSSREVEKTVALANPRDAAAESLTYVAGDVLDFRMGVSEEWVQLLGRTKDLLSQKFRRAVSAEDATFYLMSEYCQKDDPLEKAKRAEKRKKKNETKQARENHLKDVLEDFGSKVSSKSNFSPKVMRRSALTTDSEIRAETSPGTGPGANSGTVSRTGPNSAQAKCDRKVLQRGFESSQSMSHEPNKQSVLKTDRSTWRRGNNQTVSPNKSQSRYRPMEIEHQVDLRDECQCTYIDQKGKRCPSRRWLHKHHIVEFKDGGKHTVENLTTLCSAHHKIQHLKASKQSSKDRWHVPPEM